MPRRRIRLTLVLLGCLVATVASQHASQAADNRSAEKAVAGLDVAPGLSATLFASEPMMLNPTNIDVDHLGRVWVCEVVNYRHNNGKRPAGDRILVLEDTDGDGKLDKSTVFYQGRDIDSALGICVLGKKVIVSCAPNIFVFTDEDGDLKPDRKDLLFTKTGTPQHDHSDHAFVFGPDGRLYWNFGNSGRAVHDKDGKPVIDRTGKPVVDNGRPYFGGMVFRCEPDGSRFEVLAHNFRNNFEVAVDSFGSLWQSDNDDDGNRGVRINYVMEGGNYGYLDEMTGAAWSAPRTNIEKEIPLRHWHLNDPGVVPNLLQTGSGSPCGIMVYEGAALPEVFRNQVIHADAGPNIVRAYPAKQSGAGYEARIENILHGARDQWYRPSDVCVAPDGSLIIADWYDPGVGGHRQGDTEHGRLFRVALKGQERYTVPKQDYSTPEGAVVALQSPNQETRYLAWTALHGMGAKAEPALTKLWQSDNPRMRARALWLLGRIEGRGQHYVDAAIADKDADIRITGLRLARQLEVNLTPVIQKLVRDPSPAVRRECAVTLRNDKSPEAPKLWNELARQYDGKDRWYLEALGIGADGQWDRFLEANAADASSSGFSPVIWRDIVWRSRAKATPAQLAQIIRDPATPKGELPRFMRAFDFQKGAEKNDVLWQLAMLSTPEDPARGQLVSAEAIQRLVGGNPKDRRHAAALGKMLDGRRGTPEFVRVVAQFDLRDRYGELLALAQQNAQAQLGVDAVRVLLDKKETQRIAGALTGADAAAALATTMVLGTAADDRAANALAALLGNAERPLALRREAARALAKNHAGAKMLLTLAKDNKLDAALKDAVSVPLCTAVWPDVHKQAAELFPPPGGSKQPLPPIQELVKLAGDASRGKQVYFSRGTCINCHQVGSEGKEVGPNLSEIGAKLAPAAMYESILFPSAGISHNFELYEVTTADGITAIGLLVDKTADKIRLKNAEGIILSHPAAGSELRRLEVSMMPADLPKNMSTQDLSDLVAYLATLKKAP
ncbi:MAG: c-type cytochrome [Planctomycetes bacterium]|nr:c-type cytochrome [Planctomycetota bacterium]